MNVITLEDTTVSAIIKMSEESVNAAIVLKRLINKMDYGVIAMMHLDDMQIRGKKIWRAYKEHCGYDLNKFYECIFRRDEDIQRLIDRSIAE